MVIARFVARIRASAAGRGTPPVPLDGDEHERPDFAPAATLQDLPHWTPPPLFPPRPRHSFRRAPATVSASAPETTHARAGLRPIRRAAFPTSRRREPPLSATPSSSAPVSGVPDSPGSATRVGARVVPRSARSVSGRMWSLRSRAYASAGCRRLPLAGFIPVHSGVGSRTFRQRSATVGAQALIRTLGVPRKWGGPDGRTGTGQ